jgi:sugar/nucleoside kinase (ribokinase family)
VVPGPVACFSYLAVAELWRVPRWPAANHGAGITEVEYSIAGDGPMVAAALSALEVPSLLLTNGVGGDSGGAAVDSWLRQHGLSGPDLRHDRPTPRVVVVADDLGTRTWFAWLPRTAEALTSLDLSAISGARLVYADCFEIIEPAAIRVIRAARAARVPLLVNLGGSPLTASVGRLLRNCPELVVQTNVDDIAAAGASATAEALLAATNAAWAIVTAGAGGAVAASQGQRHASPAFPVEVRHTHCAGATFSAGLIYGLLHDWPMPDCLGLACASGALRCERAHHERLPALSELRALCHCPAVAPAGSLEQPPLTESHG